MFKGDLIIREIPYPKRKIKWSYDVVTDRSGRFEKGKILPSRVVLNYIIDGIKVELVDENDNSICILTKETL